MTSSVMAFGVLMLMTLLTSELPVPWQIVAPLTGAVTIWYGLRTLRRVYQLRWRGMLAPMLIGALFLTGLTTMSATTRVTVYWDEQMTYQQCTERAITIAAQDRCDREYQEAIGQSQS